MHIAEDLTDIQQAAGMPDQMHLVDQMVSYTLCSCLLRLQEVSQAGGYMHMLQVLMTA